MKKSKRILAALALALTLMTTLFQTTSVLASDFAEIEDTKETKSYTVTFRAGNVGTFNTEAAERFDSMVITENYVKFSVPKGESLPFASDEELYGFLQTLTSSVEDEEGVTTDFIKKNYRLRPIADWAEGAATKEVRRNTEYVLDYVRLVNPVMYKISFVDASSKEQVATPIIAYGEAGETIECIFGAIPNYVTTTKNGSIVLDELNPEQNEFVFECVFVGDTGTVYVPGETIVNTVINLVPGVGTPGVTVLPQGGEEVTIEEENTPLAPGENGQVTDIPEENTPLTPGETPELEDEGVPLANGGMGTFLWPILIGILAVAAVLAVVFAKQYQKKKKTS